MHRAFYNRYFTFTSSNTQVQLTREYLQSNTVVISFFLLYRPTIKKRRNGINHPPYNLHVNLPMIEKNDYVAHSVLLIGIAKQLAVSQFIYNILCQTVVFSVYRLLFDVIIIEIYDRCASLYFKCVWVTPCYISYGTVM